jgi:hypothetical protein
MADHWADETDRRATPPQTAATVAAVALVVAAVVWLASRAAEAGWSLWTP